MALAAVTLDDKYVVEQGRVFMTGTQALVRLPMLQKRRDEKAGLNTAGFISGYRGSPLGGFDQGIVAARRFISKHNIQFWPGVNEDLAATAVWGSQTTELIGPMKYDGVFAMWYAKGPGVDRCGDVFKHMNHAGTAKHGGVLLVAGDEVSRRAAEPTVVVDTVGAGDAFTAAVVEGILAARPLEEIHGRAGRLAAFVCSQPGAMPPPVASTDTSSERPRS